MNLTIRGVVDKTDANKERLVLDVTADADLVNYAIADTTFDQQGRVSNEWRHMYWFPPTKVRKGDVVVLYSKSGTNDSKKNESGATSWFFYWKLGNQVWNNDGDGALLFHIPEWDAKRA